jgi:mono/diheme cytochrome c family protein
MRIRSVFVPFLFLAIGSIFAACGGGGPTPEEGLPDCPEGGTDLTYASFGQAFFTTHCLSCHTSTSGVAGAENFPFDSQSAIQAEIEDIHERAGGTNTNMPPGGGPTAAERQQLTEWLSCGAE